MRKEHMQFVDGDNGESSDNVLVIVGNRLEWCSGKQISSSDLPVQHIRNFYNSPAKSV